MFKPAIKPNTGISNVKTSNTIIHLLPDFNTTIFDHLEHSAIINMNVHSIFVRDTIFKIGPKRINPKAYYNTLKHDIKNTDFSHMKVVRTIPKQLAKGSSIIIDYTKVIEGLQFIGSKVSDKVSLLLLFEQIKNEIVDISRSDIVKESKATQVVVASAKWKTKGLLTVLETLKKVSKKDLLLSYSTFGEYFLINTIEKHPILIPLAGHDKGRVIVYPSAITKVKSRLEDQPDTELTIAKSELDSQNTPESNTADRILNAIEPADGGYIVDRKQVSSILKRLKIKNPNVESAVKQFVEAKIKKEISKNSKAEISQTQIEDAVVKAISYSLTAKKNADIDPALIISRLAESDSQAVPLKLPNSFEETAISPVSVVNVDRISGVNRQEFEFTENIKPVMGTLFKVLENKKSHPIKVIKMKVTDNNDSQNIYKTFEVTLKNLNGGDSKQYTVSVNIPSIVNDKYFRLNGKDYIISTQQYLKPIVKDKPADIRFLTHYNMTRMNIVNIKHNVVDYNELINTIQSKYPDMIVDMTSDSDGISYVKFSNDLEIWPKSNDMFARDNTKVYTLDGSKVFIELNAEDKIETNNAKTETMFHIIFTTLTDKYPKEASKTSSAPYLQVYSVGIKMPFILMLWQQLGLLDALVKMSIDYEISDIAPTGSTVSIPLSNGKSIWLKPSSYRQELIANGILAFQRNNKFQLDANDLNNREQIRKPLNKKFGNSSFDKLDLANETMIDPTTEKLLKDDGLPTDYMGVMAGPMLDKLFNEKPSHPNDLSTMRARQAEVMSELIYNELGMAYNRYQKEVKQFGNKEAKIFLDQNYIIDNLIGKHPNSKFKGGAIIDYADLYSPVDELVQASKVIRTGKGGIPNTRSFRKEQRTLHPSSHGNISAHATPEYANVGVVNHHCLGAQISKNGIYGGKVDNTRDNPWSSVAINEALTPFQNQMNSDRLIMATTHSSQKIPISNAEVPLVGTGAEAMVAQLSSSKFIHNARMNGKVISKKEGSYLTVQYDNGKKETFDIADRKALISGNTNILISMKSLNVGDKFKAHEAVTWSSNFKDNQLANGKNMIMAVMSRNGKNFEDGYAISKKVSIETRVEKLHRIPILIDKDVEIVTLLSKLGTETTSNDILIEFKYGASIDDFLAAHDIMTADSDVGIEETSKNTIKTTSPGGKLVDIRIVLNDTKNMDASIVAAWKSQNNRIKAKLKALSEHATTKKENHDDNVHRDTFVVGKHKFKGALFDGALIEFFLVEEQELSKGDKIAGRAGTKGVVTDIYNEAKGDYSGDIDIFISPLSILGRKNTVVVKELWIGKIMYNLPEIVSNMLKNGKKLPVVKAMIFEVYKMLDTTTNSSNLNSFKDKLSAMNDAQVRKALIDKKIMFNILFPPFTNIGFKPIKAAAALLEIPLMEKIYDSKTETWSKQPVPVGINYISRMEQFSDDKESTRSTAGYKNLTGQPDKGKAQHGGQSIGGMDTFAFLTYEAPEILQELMGARSDNFQAKVKMLNDLRVGGKVKLEDLPTNQGQTRKNLDVFMLSMGLDAS